MRALPGILVAAVLMIGGCTAAPGENAQVVETPAPAADAFTAPEEACAVLSDVGTIVANWNFAQGEERLVGNEYNGGMRLAARLLGRIDLEPGTKLAEVVGDLQKAAPAAPVGGMSTGVDSSSDAWIAAWARVADACNEALGNTDPLNGAGFGVEGWVGG